ncbi:MAG: sugar ABC transporter permease [Actinomycetaceae bacterium]|nr:sugar ABC transporter permease [Actinomycetaceae bacterium]
MGRWLNNFGFTIPFLVFYVFFVLYPVIQAILMSFFDWDLLGKTPRWIGLDNYKRMFGGVGIEWGIHSYWWVQLLLLVIGILLAIWAIRNRRMRAGEILLIVSLLGVALLLGFQPGEDGSWNDPRFWNAFKNTVIFTAVSTPLIAGLGLVFALLLDLGNKGSGFYRAALFVPYLLPVSVTTLIWGYMLNPSRGIVSRLTETLGIGVVAWLSDPRTAMAAIVITTVWWTVGFNMILFGAGLQDIDPTLYEAASIDGAGPWQKFISITLPGLKHATLLVVVTQIIASFQIFGQVNIMTSGGPGGVTDVLVRYIYQTGFRNSQLGYASAMSLFLFTVMVFISIIQFLMSRERRS